MGHVYLKFKTKEIISFSQQVAPSVVSKMLGNGFVKILTTIIPNANPDFDDKISSVKQWVLEVNEEDGVPWREIGLDSDGDVLMIMPWKDNCGFWTDSNVEVDILTKSPEMMLVDKAEFDKLWNEFENKVDETP